MTTTCAMCGTAYDDPADARACALADQREAIEQARKDEEEGR